jgi:RecA-family ATPase
VRVGLDDFNTIPETFPLSFKNGERRLMGIPASQIERKQVRWFANGRVPIGYVTVLGGYGGLGKSQWTCLLASKLSRGELGEPAVTLIATAEDDPDTTVVPRLEALQADLDLVHFLHIETKDGEDGIHIPDDLPQIDQMALETGARLIVIDPIMAHLPLKIESHNDQSVRAALNPLYRMARARQCAVLVVMHFNKTQGLKPLQRLGGSVAFGNAVRSVLIFDRDPEDPEGERGARRLLTHVKHNVGREQPTLAYEIKTILLEAKGTSPMAETSRLELVEEVSHLHGVSA